MVVDGAASAAGQLAADVDEASLVAALRAGDDGAFRALVQCHHGALVRLARASGASHAVAQELVRDTWLAAIKGVAGFDGQPSLKIWIFRLLMERTRQPTGAGSADDAPAVHPDRFVSEGQRWAGHWSAPPVPWTSLGGEQPITKETMAAVVAAIDALPDRQRQVVTLRDVEGWSAAEVCAVLGISEINQQALLHRGRSRVRACLEDRLTGKG